MSPAAEAALRDTDLDWRQIGNTEPFWGVITAPQFRQENLTAENLAAFYATGITHMAELAATFEKLTGEPFHPANALDFGCGTGRLAEAMTTHANAVTGYDISPGMLEAARRHGAGRVSYTGTMPEDVFDWLNSYIVFQHIPAPRGLELLSTLLGKLAPRAYVSLHFTIYRDAVHRAAPPPNLSPARRLIRRLRRSTTPPPETGTVMMYDYNLNMICELLHGAGINQMLLAHEDHGGHHGVRIYGRKEK